MNARNTEMLINLVKPNVCLYDTTHDDYKNIQLKEGIWLQIAKQLDKDVSTVRADWKKIRDCHRDAIKRRRLFRNEKDAKDVKKWKYEDQMSFLLNHMTNRKREPYFDNADCPNGASDNDDNSVIHEPIVDDTFAIAYDGFISHTQSQIQQNNVAGSSRSPIKQASSSSSENAMDLFFDAMCATTKRLPKRYQVQIKRELFDLVNRYEEAALEYDDSLR